jgi:hypothetical protein
MITPLIWTFHKTGRRQTSLPHSLKFGWDAKHLPDPKVILTNADFIDKDQLVLKPQALDRCVQKLVDNNIGFIQIPKVEILFPDLKQQREAFVRTLPLALFKHNPMAFLESMERNMAVHPHGWELRKLMTEDPKWFLRVNAESTHRYREHGERFIDPGDDIYRGHYAHHEYTGDERAPEQIVLLLCNGYWDFNQIEGTEPVVMDMEEYRIDYNRQAGITKKMEQQPKIIGGPRDAIFPPDDPRRKFSWISTTDYSKSADIILLNNVRVGHARMPGKRLPPYEVTRRPLYQSDLTIGRYGKQPVGSLIKPKDMRLHNFKRFFKNWLRSASAS